MKKKCFRWNTWSSILVFLLFASIYAIIAIDLCPGIKIPCKLFSNKEIESVNTLLLHLSIAYFSACVFWVVTVPIRDHQARRKYKWLIHDQLNSLNEQIRPLLYEIGIDKAYSFSDFEQYVSRVSSNSTDQDALRTKTEDTDKIVIQLINQKLPWSETELNVFAEIHNICRLIEETIPIEPKDANTTKMIYRGIQQLKKLSLEIEAIAQAEIKQKISIENNPETRKENEQTFKT